MAEHVGREGGPGKSEPQKSDKPDKSAAKGEQALTAGKRREELGRREGGRGGVPANPFALVSLLFEEMDRVVSELGFGPGLFGRMPGAPRRGRGGGIGGAQLWSPQVEMLERGEDLVVRADLPGLDKDDVDLELTDGALVISGERKSEEESEGRGVWRSERHYGGFRRVIGLPEGVDAEQAQARFENGVLEITFKLPKKEAGKQRRIPIQGGEPRAKGGEGEGIH